MREVAILPIENFWRGLNATFVLLLAMAIINEVLGRWQHRLSPVRHVTLDKLLRCAAHQIVALLASDKAVSFVTLHINVVFGD